MTSPFKIGDVLAGKYEVERILGQGGMGVVVSAKHLQLGERVAIKFLLPDAVSKPGLVQRFLREGRAAAKLKSEHAARVFDVGTLEGDVPYLVMEHLSGSDLGALLRGKGKLPVETAVEYVLQACEAIAEAHGFGIVHRDLKPSNLFLTTTPDGSPQIKVIDFGISKMVEESGDGEMTSTAMMMGSPLYMAPEQMASAKDADARSDIWSLGVILFALTTGRLPFKAASALQIFELVLKGPPSAHAINPLVSPELDAVLTKCLQRERSARFPTVAEFALAIAPFAPVESQVSTLRFRRMRASIASVSSEKEAPVSTPSVPIGIVTPAPESVSEAPIASSRSANIGPTDPGATDGTWGRTGPPTRRRTRTFALAGGALAATLALGIVGGRLLSPGAPRVDAATTSPVSPTPSTPSAPVASASDAQAAVAPTAPVVTPLPVVAPSGAPSADAAPPQKKGSAKTSQAAAPRAKMDPTPPKTSAPTAPAPKKDLFSEPL